MFRYLKEMIRGCLILLCLMGTQEGYAQWVLEIEGGVESQNDRSKLEGAKLTVLRNGSKSDQVIADSKGKFSVSLGPDAKYMLEFSADGYVTKRISFDTRFVPPEISAEGNFTFRFDLSMFQAVEGLDVSILNKPIAEVKYDPKIFDFNYDKDYTKSIKTQVAKLQADLEEKMAAAAAAAAAAAKAYSSSMADGNKAMGHKDYSIAIGHFEEALTSKPADKAATEKLKEAKELQIKYKAEKDKEKAYTEAIELAEAALNDDELKEAETQFEKAFEAKPQDAYARDQLKEVRALIVARAKAEQTYITAIGKADAALAQKDYLKAKAEYTTATEAKPKETYPQDQLKEVESLILADAQKESDYIKAIERGEISMENKDYEASKSAFSQASEIKPAEKYPKDQMAKIDALLADIALKNSNYTEAIKKADDFLTKNDFQNAKTSYKEALDMKPTEQYPKDQIAKIEAQLAEMEKNAAAYNELIADADKRFEGHDYVAAKAEYQKALDLKPQEKHPADRIAEISTLLVEMAKVEEDYKHAISNGDGAFNGKDYNSAKFEYEAASKLKPEEQYPKDQLSKIATLLEDIAKKEEAYTAAIAAGDVKFKANEFEAAKAGYTQAAGIKPEEAYPKEQLKLIDEKLVELANLSKAFDAAIAEADQLLGDKKYEDAKGKYQSALDMKPTEAYPKEKIAEITGLMADLQKKEGEYQSFISSGDAAFKEKNYDGALASFQSAAGLKPEETYPTEKINEINQLKAELAATQQQYDELITKADGTFKANDLTTAKSEYQEASKIKPEESYPKDQIALIDGKIKALEEQDKSYQEAIAKAETAEKNNDLAVALESYKAAASIKPEETLPPEKIASLTSLMADLSKKEEAYNAAIALADEAKKSEEFDIALTQYKAASEIKPDEQYPKDQMLAVNDLKAAALAAIALKNKQNEEYQALIKEADDFKTAENYENSKEKYRAALAIKPEESYPKEQIAEINKLTMALAEQQAVDEKYQAAIVTADAAFEKKDYDASKAAYNEAKSIKPSENYPVSQLKAIDEAIAAAAALAMQMENEKAAQEREEKYVALIAAADQSFKSEDWEGAKADYNAAKDLKPSEAYPKDQLLAIEEAIAAAAALAAQQASEMAAQEKEAQYAALIASADKAFDSKDWTQAKNDYQGAKGIKPAETYPDERLKAIDEAIAAEAALAAQQANEMAAQEKEAKYNAFIERGDQAFDSKDWDNAKAEYKGAKGVKPEEAYPDEQLAAIDAAIANASAEAKALAAKEKEEKYLALIASADQSFDKKDWTGAKADYTKAKGVKPSETYPDEKLVAIDEAIAAEAALAAQQAALNSELEKEALYNSWIDKGDQSFKGKDWENAKYNYQEALNMKPNEAYPKDQIAKIDQEIENDKLMGKKDQYDAYITTADKSFKSRDWESAKSNYTSAIALMPDEEYPKDQLKRVDQAIEDEAAMALKNETGEAYRQLLGDADQLFNAEDYQAAKGKYKEALGVKPDESYPKEKIAEIDEIMTAVANAGQAVDKEYAEWIQKADELMDKEALKDARSAYEKALTVKRKETYPQSQIAKIDQMLNDKAAGLAASQAAAQKQKKYDQLIASADGKFGQKSYESAKGDYESASNVFPNEAYPKKKIAEIEGLLTKKVVVAAPPLPKKSASGMSEAEIAAMMAEWQNERNQSKVDQMNQFKKDIKEVSDDRVSSADERRLESNDELDQLEVSIKESNKSGEDRNLDEAMLVGEFKEDQENFQNNMTKNSEEKRNAYYTNLEETEEGQKEMKEKGNELYGFNTEKMTTQKIDYQQQQSEDRQSESEKLTDEHGKLVDLEEGIREDQKNNNERYMKDVEKIQKDNADVVATVNNWNDESRENRGDAYAQVQELENNITDFNDVNRESYMNNTVAYWKTVDDLYDYNKDKTKQSRKNGKKAYNEIVDYSEGVSELTQERNNNYEDHNEQVKKQQMAVTDYQAGLTADADERRLNYHVEYYVGENKPRYAEKAKGYPQGVTEETRQEAEAFIVKRIVVRGEDYNEYEKIYYKWGGIFYKKNNEEITEFIWNIETQ